MNTVLTIAIPTFNRKNRLQRCLEELLVQTQGKPVELLVSDNASEDDTQQFMEAFCCEHEQVTYVRNFENVGPDRNFLNCYNRACGEYVLLLGDDDLLLPGAVDSMLEALSRKPVMVYLNTCNIISQEPLIYTPPRNPEGDMVVLHEPTDMLETMGIFVTFMSSFILRNDLVQRICDKERYIGTYFIQSHIALNTMCEDGEYIYVRKKCLAASGNESVNYDVYFVWGKMYSQLLNDTAVSVGMDARRIRAQHKKDLQQTIASFVKVYRKSCVNSSKWDKKAIMDEVRQYPKLYIRYWAAVYLPLPIFEAALSLKSVVKKILGRQE